jgi:hypothetical protein
MDTVIVPGVRDRTLLFATTLLSFRHSIKNLHWMTRSYATHKATDGYLTKLDDLIDRIIETYSARYGRPSTGAKFIQMRVMVYTSFSEALQIFAKEFLQTAFTKFVNPDLDTDLITLRDELLSETMTALYLSTFE